MCKVEDSIIACSEQSQLKSLYEKMGDGACDLKIFSKALEYYKKMLEAAEKSGASDKELGECYFSLGNLGDWDEDLQTQALICCSQDLQGQRRL